VEGRGRGLWNLTAISVEGLNKTRKSVEYGSMGDSHEHGNETSSGSTKDDDFLDRLDDYRLLRKDSVPTEL
jgi:hypothetical protein